MVEFIRPESFGAAGDGVTPDDAAMAATVAECNATGKSPLFTNPYAVSQQFVITRSGVEPTFQERGCLVAAGSGSLYGLLQIGPNPQVLTGISAPSGAQAGDETIALSDASGLAVGELVRLQWTNEFSMISALAAVVTAKAGNTITLSEPVREAIPAGQAFGAIYHSVPIEDVVVRGFRAKRGAFTGTMLAGLKFSQAKNCSAQDVDTVGMTYGGLVIATAVDFTGDNIRSRCDGVSSSSLEVYGLSRGALSDIALLDCRGFGAVLSNCSGVLVNGITLRNRGSAFGRGLKLSNARFIRVTDVDCCDWAGAGIWLENYSHHVNLVRPHVVGTRIAPPTIGALGIAIGYQHCDQVRLLYPVAVGTDTTNGGVDFTVSSPVGGVFSTGITAVAPRFGTTWQGSPYTVI